MNNHARTPAPEDCSPKERRFYQSLTQQVDRAVKRLEAKGFFRDEPPKRQQYMFGRNLIQRHKS